MFRFILAVLAIVTLGHFTVDAIDISQNKNVALDLLSVDALKDGDSGSNAKDRASAFIGDLTVGRRLADETVFRRILDFENPTDGVQSTTLNVSITDGSIHYISVRNVPGSYAVVCDTPNALGSSRSSFNLRLQPKSQATLTLIIAAHNYLARSAPSA